MTFQLFCLLLMVSPSFLARIPEDDIVQEENSPLNPLARLITQTVTSVLWKSTTVTTTVPKTCAIYLEAPSVCPKSVFPQIAEIVTNEQNEFELVKPSEPFRVQTTIAPEEFAVENTESSEVAEATEIQGSLEDETRTYVAIDDLTGLARADSTTTTTRTITLTRTVYKSVTSGTKFYLIGRCTPTNSPLPAC